MDKYIYLDNNGNVPMDITTINSMLQCINVGNPSAIFFKESTNKIIDYFNSIVCELVGITLSKYNIIITSSASESNSTFLDEFVNMYNTNGKIPKILSSLTEHHSVLSKLQTLSTLKKCEVHYFQSNDAIKITDLHNWVAAYGSPNLICLMTVNNETGEINRIDEISRYCSAKGIAIYSDCAQVLGKYRINDFVNRLDGFCLSMQKIGGPIGVGVLCIKKTLSDRTLPIITGTQNNGLRGGTYNIAGIYASYNAMKIISTKKISDLITLRNKFNMTIKKYFDIVHYSKFNGTVQSDTIVIFNPENSVPSCILCCIIINKTIICGQMLQEFLFSRNIIVGLGSACNGNNNSSVLSSRNIDPKLLTGVIRISMFYNNTLDDIDKLCFTLSKYSE